MGNTRNYKEKETLRIRGSRKYRERLVEEHEAEDEIKTFDRGELIEDDTEIIIDTEHEQI